MNEVMSEGVQVAYQSNTHFVKRDKKTEIEE